MSGHHTTSSSSSSGYKYNAETRSSTSRSSFSSGDVLDPDSRRKLFDRHFSSAGLPNDDDFLSDFRTNPFRDRPFFSSSAPLWPRRRLACGATSEEVRLTPERFRLLLDVALFEADDLSVVTCGRHVVVSAKHGERQCSGSDAASLAVSREFRHRYLLPDDASPDLVTSALTRDGILIVEGPRRPTPGPSTSGERIVSISTSDVDGVSPEGAKGLGNKS